MPFISNSRDVSILDEWFFPVNIKTLAPPPPIPGPSSLSQLYPLFFSLIKRIIETKHAEIQQRARGRKWSDFYITWRHLGKIEFPNACGFHCVCISVRVRLVLWESKEHWRDPFINPVRYRIAIFELPDEDNTAHTTLYLENYCPIIHNAQLHNVISHYFHSAISGFVSQKKHCFMTRPPICHFLLSLFFPN